MSTIFERVSIADALKGSAELPLERLACVSQVMVVQGRKRIKEGSKYIYEPNGYFPKMLDRNDSPYWLFDGAATTEEHELGTILRDDKGKCLGLFAPSEIPGTDYVFLQKHHHYTEDDLLTKGISLNRWLLRDAQENTDGWGWNSRVEVERIAPGLYNVKNVTELNGESTHMFSANRAAKGNAFHANVHRVNDYAREVELGHTGKFITKFKYGGLFATDSEVISDRHNGTVSRDEGVRIAIEGDYPHFKEVYPDAKVNDVSIDDDLLWADYVVKPEKATETINHIYFTFDTYVKVKKSIKPVRVSYNELLAIEEAAKKQA